MSIRVINLKSFLKKFFFLTFIAIISNKSIASSIAKSEILLHIATQCVDTSLINYCSDCMLPRLDTSCGKGLECKKTNEVWQMNSEYVAIRDIKMCGCPKEFIHGLAMPTTPVTGVEDPLRPESIWPFAWNVGIDRIEENSLALVVNPKSQRTQNQLHIHLLRLNQDARQKFKQYGFAIVGGINHVWDVAEKIANSSGLSDYGVLVSRYSENSFIVLVSKDSPEALFTVWNCNSFSVVTDLELIVSQNLHASVIY
jgi:CDP-diacylglycerol pyrophosphatase